MVYPGNNYSYLADKRSVEFVYYKTPRIHTSCLVALPKTKISSVDFIISSTVSSETWAYPYDGEMTVQIGLCGGDRTGVNFKTYTFNGVPSVADFSGHIDYPYVEDNREVLFLKFDTCWSGEFTIKKLVLNP